MKEKVIQIGIKSTKLQDINNGDIYVVSNRNIEKALTESDQLDIDIPLPYDENVENIESAINLIIERAKEQVTTIQSIEYKGLNGFGDSAIYYKIRMYTKPELKPQTKRDVNRIIKVTLDERKIEILFTQIDIHNK